MTAYPMTGPTGPNHESVRQAGTGKVFPGEGSAEDARGGHPPSWCPRPSSDVVSVGSPGPAVPSAQGRSMAAGAGGTLSRLEATSGPGPAPAWLSDAVFYQVVPDRFAREKGPLDVRGLGGVSCPPGQSESAGPDGVPLQPWSARPGSSGRGGREFFGGNLRGLTGRLDHIRELGADAILMTPINRAPSYHRYDTTDFRALDPLLGTWDDLDELVRQAHARGLRLVFDVALNHVSRDHPWFRAAAGGGDAREREYFRFLENGKYLCWWGFGHMPELQLDHPDLLDELFLGEDSVLAFWLGKGFDGVRLDCANDLTFPLCGRINEAVKARFPDAAVLGEICNFSAPWLDALDGTQSYFFTASLKAVWQKSISHGQFQRNMQMAYGGGAFRQFQMLSSHDIPRARTEFATDPAFLRAARRLQFTLPGIPMVYYGEEFGLEGGKDPDNRATVPWETWPVRRLEPDTRELQDLIRLRKASPELRAGRWEPVSVDGLADLVAFFRVLPDDPRRFTLVAWNDAPQARSVTLTIPWGWLFSEVELREVFSGRRCQVSAGLITLPLEPRECSIWQINPGNKGSYSFFKSWHLP